MSDMFHAITYNERELQRRLEGIARYARRPRLAMHAIAQALETITDENFEAEGRPKWEELSDVTKFLRLGGKKAYRRDGSLRAAAQRTQDAMKILQDSGKLAGSVHGDAGDDWASVGAWGPYARIQQLGGKAGRGRKVTLPARPYLPFSKDFKLQPEAEKAVLDAALRQLQKAAD